MRSKLKTMEITVQIQQMQRLQPCTHLAKPPAACGPVLWQAPLSAVVFWGPGCPPWGTSDAIRTRCWSSRAQHPPESGASKPAATSKGCQDCDEKHHSQSLSTVVCYSHMRKSWQIHIWKMSENGNDANGNSVPFAFRGLKQIRLSDACMTW